MSGTAPPPNPPVRAKRGVGLSGIVAGNTSVATSSNSAGNPSWNAAAAIVEPAAASAVAKRLTLKCCSGIAGIIASRYPK